MPLSNAAAHQARIGMFYSGMQSGRDDLHAKQKLQGLLAISNTPSDRRAGPYVQAHDEVYQALTIPINALDPQEPSRSVAASGMTKVMNQHPVATCFVGAVVVLSTVGFVARSATGSSQPAPAWSGAMPKPQALNVLGIGPLATSATFVDICRRALGEFPSASDAQAPLPSMAVLQSIKRDAEDIRRVARILTSSSEAGSQALARAAQCSGGLLGEKVEPMINDLQARILRLQEEENGISIGGPLSNLSVQLRIKPIHNRLVVLNEIDEILRQATEAINARLLQMAG